MRDERYGDSPENLKYYAGAVACNRTFWTNEETIRDFLLKEGDRTNYCNSVMSFFHSLSACLVLYNSGRFNRIPLADVGGFLPVDITSFSTSQRRVYFEITTSLRTLDAFDRVPVEVAEAEDLPEGEEEDHNVNEPNPVPDVPLSVDGPVSKCFLVYGEAGSGKSYVIRSLIQFCLQHNLLPAVGCPTGKLASTFSYEFPGVRCDTVHSLFNILVGEGNRMINWGLSNIHLLVIDEITQVPTSFIEHIY